MWGPARQAGLVRIQTFIAIEGEGRKGIKVGEKFVDGRVRKGKKGYEKRAVSEGVDPWKVRPARSGVMGRGNAVCDAKGVEEESVRLALGRAAEGRRGDLWGEVGLTRSAVALAMMCRTLLLMPAKKAAHLKKIWS